MPRLILSGGGTGGHVYPALAVAEALAERAHVVYVGSVGGMEERIVTQESTLPFRSLPAAAVRGRGPVQVARSLPILMRGIGAALALLRREQPAAILGTGGYVCVPLFVAAKLRRVPTMIYLPDVVPGLAVKVLSRIADVTAVNVSDALPRLGLYEGHPRAMVTGYPVRAELFSTDREAARAAFGIAPDQLVLLVYGGSRGARSVNRAIATLLPSLLPLCTIIHVCGREGDHVWLEATAAQLEPELRGRYLLFPYLAGGSAQSMTAALAAADVAVCRSGASTLAELPAVGLPAVLVPYPYVHQDENADYLVQRGAAMKVADHAMLGDGDPTDGPLAQAIRTLLSDVVMREQMAARSRALARPDAAQRLADALIDLARSSA
ncbi:UDP-N-acetylglucosamine--N-acetylmuramyl-(pentapeptide) pyrophosphoryl-undecaprenol N-acetylglucosamine transferase [Chloroflexus aggregans]|uniref:UDP-N-acetylglucosamine--N-acetylmuramyl-(pentapeptide) pyrophosphoryl-undecaprenol N-acetylglucosamine transferase n=1 Tax=Chloroflexus aggregans (strain MD-66 / DSM 9485) TaxID=326427 RepID=B8G5Y1_CHLAD|nr:UDP-N-acetylglucosamine--N-acetylmuramyl-(pentapeptide) pyrophosphoryl-undecaprenol N-acetylglucosamine transferase [Chloroflexus aggregans]ACL25714.1 UDP-N-acetylglucosamine--N-acetylmuramyl-(pentapeptide) pyrophosphoryl-undecaprenol N-acetylglucosamine transferase [Chloroflexus aggregans DSM 9485]